MTLTLCRCIRGNDPMVATTAVVNCPACGDAAMFCNDCGFPEDGPGICYTCHPEER